MTRTLRFLALLLLLAPSAAKAQDDLSCSEFISQSVMNECLGRQFQRADSLLDATWQRVIGDVEPERVPLLRRAQWAWMHFRDAECAFERSEFEGGRMAPGVEASCMTDQTRARVAYLRRVLPGSPGERRRAEVIQAAHRLFDALRERDVAALTVLLHPRAIIVGIAPGGQAQVRTAQEWLGAMAESREVLDERMWDVRVEIDGDLATLWAPYDFRRDGRFSHCGTDAFQFVRQDGAWKLIAVTFTRRTTQCEGPQF